MTSLNPTDFVELIETEGCKKIDEHDYNAITVYVFLSLSGKRKVYIKMDGELPISLAKIHCKELELDDLLDRYFQALNE